MEIRNVFANNRNKILKMIAMAIQNEDVVRTKITKKLIKSK